MVRLREIAAENRLRRKHESEKAPEEKVSKDKRGPKDKHVLTDKGGTKEAFLRLQDSIDKITMCVTYFSKKYPEAVTLAR